MLLKNFILFSLFISVNFTTISAAEVELKGLAIHEELRVPVYFAATSGSPPKSTEVFIKQPQAFKVEVRYIIEKFSARRNNRLWMNAILVGNSREKLKSVEQAVLEFSRMIRFEMRKGDQIVFDIDPTKGTTISLNGINLGVIKDIGFQSALINIWYSERQTTKIFSQQIRTKPNYKVLKKFQALSFQANRVKPVIALQAALIEADRAEINQDVKLADNQQSGNSSTENQSKKSVDRVAKAESKKATKTPKRSTKSTKKNSVIKKSQTQSKNSKSKNEKSKTPPIKNRTRNQTKVAKIESSSVVDQIFNTLRNDYQIDLKEYFEKKSRPIPPVKIRRKPRGKAVLSISIRKEQQKMVIINTQITTSDFEASLQDAIHQSVKRLSAIPVMPDALKDEIIIIDVTLDFSKCRRATSAWICF